MAQALLSPRIMTPRRNAGFLLFLILLLGSLPAQASLQCASSELDPAIQIEPIAVGEVLEPEDLVEGEPVAVFRITGIRPKRTMRVGFHSWQKARETPKPHPDGYGSKCESFEHFVLVWVREDTSKQPGELLIQYQYGFSKESILDGRVVALKLPKGASYETRALPGPASVAFEADQPIWGVFLGASPRAGESIPETAARADRALVLHVSNADG